MASSSVKPVSDTISDRPAATSRYEVIELLGRGGMATVHRVRDHATGQIVAQKHLLTASDAKFDAKVRVLFEREFHVLSQLAHPRVVKVYDYGIDTSGPYYTMELLDGGDLHALAPMPWQRACSLMRDVCSVMSLLHSRGLVHRDVSPRNVRCTNDGQAKLLDFGAMAAMGPIKQIVATPPICAPEVLDLEPLDARSDLYSLGATFYYALTGRHAYPARELRQLHDLWQMPAPPPSVFKSDIPTGVDALVMSLLSLDSAARPVSAAEVMDRLAAIAQLPADDQLVVSNAYLHAPNLVGRKHLVERTRRRFLRTLQGKGNATMLVGVAGVGRSRMFSACLLEAKLLGMTVLRADASDGERGEYGGVRALALQLLDYLPAETLDSAEPRIAVLGHILPELLPRLPATQLVSFEDPVHRRPRIQQALREWLYAICARHPIAIGIDDVDLIDEPTRAFTTLLAREIAPHAIGLIVSAQTEATQVAVGPMKVLADASSKLELMCLDLDETDQLLTSLFGDAPYRQNLAHKLFAISAGNPRDIMQLARHLVERGAIRYASGSWSLPAHIDQADLPATIALAHKARLDALSDDSRLLAQTLALAPDLALGFDHVQALCGHADQARMLRSLDELLTRSVFRNTGKHMAFAQPVFASLLRDDLHGEARRSAHLRLAALFEIRNEPFRVAQHLLRAGEDQRGVDTLVAHARASVQLTDQNLQAYEDLLQWLPRDWFETYRTGIALCQQLGRPRRDLYALWMRVSGLTPAGLGDTSAVVDLIAQLRRDTGLDIYESLDTTMEPLARLGKSFELAGQRHQATPEADRVLEGIEALRALGRACIQACGTVTARLDFELWETLPSLKPFEPLSPALAVVELLVQGLGERIRGRTEQARVLYGRLLERATQPDRAGLDETHQRYMVSGVRFGLGFMEAPFGLDSALAHATAIENDPLHQVNALLIRMLYQLWHGDARAADACKQQVESLRIQNSPRILFEGTHLIGEIAAHAACDDLVRLKQSIDSLTALTRDLPGWQPLLYLARGESQRIRGAYADALHELESGLALAAAGRHQVWPELASAYVKTLDTNGDHQRACEHGERFLAEAERVQLGSRINYIKLALATAYASSGERERAELLADTVIASFHDLGADGLCLGLSYEARARVASRVRDRENFELYARKCGTVYRAKSNRSLIAKYEALMREARGTDSNLQAFIHGTLLTGQQAATAITGMLMACPDPRDRAKLGLDMLLARSGACGGFLFAIDTAGPVLVAQAGHDELPVGMLEFVAERLRAELEDTESTGPLSEAASETGTHTRLTELGTTGRQLRPTLIGHTLEQAFKITGMALLVVEPGGAFVDPSDVATHLSRTWFDNGDVTSLTGWRNVSRPPA